MRIWYLIPVSQATLTVTSRDAGDFLFHFAASTLPSAREAERVIRCLRAIRSWWLIAVKAIIYILYIYMFAINHRNALNVTQFIFGSVGHRITPTLFAWVVWRNAPAFVASAID